jgi:hypothetical protein
LGSGDSNRFGADAGLYSFNGRDYRGGVLATGDSQPGFAPGGGGSGASAVGPGGWGGVGAIWYTAYQTGTGGS